MTTFQIYATAMPSVEPAAEFLGLRTDLHPSEGKARRALNVAVAAVGLIITAPLMLGIAILVRLTSPGPILYRQVRVGVDKRKPGVPPGNHRRAIDYGGVPFTIYKFRTMAAAASRHGRQVWASPDDARVTFVGRFLRKFRLDELPQLFNVLTGDMNVVGPRPEQPTIFADLRTQVHSYTYRQRVRPGITGLAQINQHYDTSIEDVRRKVAFDLEYIAEQSFLQDLRIMLFTAPVLVFRKGAW